MSTPETDPNAVKALLPPHPLVRLFNLLQVLPHSVRDGIAAARWFERLSGGGKRKPSAVHTRALEAKTKKRGKLGPETSRRAVAVSGLSAKEVLLLLDWGHQGAASCLQALPAGGQVMDAALNPNAMVWSVTLYRALVEAHNILWEIGLSWEGTGFDHRGYVIRLERVADVVQRSLGEVVAVMELSGIASAGTPLDVSEVAGQQVPMLMASIDGLTVKVLCTCGDIKAGTLANIRKAAKVPGRKHGQGFTLDEVSKMLTVCLASSASNTWRAVGERWKKRLSPQMNMARASGTRSM